MTDLLVQADQPQLQYTAEEALIPKTIFIYGLRCPLSNQIRYVGQTRNPPVRFRSHLRDRCETHKGYWIRSLRAAGMSPSMEILESVPFDRRDVAECRWIDSLAKQGCRLTNSTAGGLGSGIVFPHVKVKMSSSQKRRWDSMTEEQLKPIRARRSEANRVRVLSPESRARMSAALTGKVQSQEIRVKIGNANRLRIASMSEEEKAIWISKRVHPSTPESRRKVAEALRGIKRKGSTSCYRGVSWYGKTSRWKSYITLNKRMIHLGYFIDEMEAARTYDVAAVYNFGESAVLNFPVTT